MPTKIVTTASNNLKGEINVNDLNKIIDQFENHISLSADNSRPITKLNEVSIPLVMLEKMIASVSANQKLATNVLIKFGVTLEGQTDCFDGETVLENHLTVAVLLETGGKPLRGIGDSVITSGFREAAEEFKEFSEGPCCPVIKPGS